VGFFGGRVSKADLPASGTPNNASDVATAQEKRRAFIRALARQTARRLAAEVLGAAKPEICLNESNG
jgi:hypothetical protein